MFQSLRNLSKSEFFRNIATLATGTTIAQIIPIIISPLLTRIYAPEDFGRLALFVSVFSIVAIIVTLQYEAAIVLPKDDTDAISLVGLCLLITIGISFFTLLVVVVFNEAITHLLGDETISFWLYFVPIPVFLAGLFNTLNYWTTRKKQYKRLASRTISQSLATAGSKLVFGVLKYLNGGLIVGTLLGQTTATMVLAVLSWKDDKKEFVKLTKKGIVKNAKKYKNFPKYTAWQGFFDMLNASGTAFIISALLGSKILGLYAFTLSLLQKPLQFIGNSVSQVYYQRASEIYNSGGNIWRITRKLLIRLFIISIIVFLPIAFAGPKLFAFVFGEEWFEAGIYAQVLLPWFVVRFIGSPITGSINILGKQKAFFFATLLLNIFFPILLWSLLKFDISFKISLVTVSTMTGLYMVFVVYWIRSILMSPNNY